MTPLAAATRPGVSDVLAVISDYPV
jgi:hypothetical protein